MHQKHRHLHQSSRWLGDVKNRIADRPNQPRSPDPVIAPDHAELRWIDFIFFFDFFFFWVAFIER